MALTVTFYVFGKRENSTKIPPSGTTQTQFQCELKNDCDIRNPILIINPSAGLTPFSFNYCYIPSFTRYYFVNEWRWINGLWECQLIVDVLATFRSSIGTSSQYVLRSASKFNGAIVDTMYPITNQMSVGKYSITAGQINFDIASGYFVIGVISADSSIGGAVSYYVFTYSQFNTFKQMLLGSITWTGVSTSEMSEELLKTLFNPFQYIVSCRWFPSVPSGYLTAVTSIKFGWWEFQTSCSKYTSSLSFENKTISIDYTNIPKHPQANRGNYLNRSPFSEYYLMKAPYGIIQIPDNITANTAGFTLVETIDYFTGDCALTILEGTGNNVSASPILTAIGKMGVDIQLAQVSSNVLGAGMTAGSGIASGLSDLVSGNFAGAVMNTASAISSAVQQIAPTVQTGGGTGSFADIGRFAGDCYLSAKFYSIADEDISDLGRPLCQANVINTLSGFILVAHADIALVSTDVEQQKVKAYMESGFFWE